MDHDRLFKELLRTFFIEFLELFFSTLAKRIDRAHPPVFLDKEDFGQDPSVSRREMDMVVRLRLHDGDAHFLVHLEHEAQKRGDLPGRMFRYFSRIWDRHQLPIYPIALLSFGGLKAQPQRFSLQFHDLAMLDFRYRTVQLSRMDWRSFLNSANPVASALMARMQIREQDRPIVKLQCLRLLATLRLDERKCNLIAHFVYSYLRLNADEMRIYQRNLEIMPQRERQAIMQFTNEWKEEGRLEGRLEGRVEGRLEGRVEGRVEGRSEELRDGLSLLLHRLYGERAAGLISRLATSNLDALRHLQQQLIAGADLEQLTLPEA
ncbi:MAG: Rpn family recombination-promoting nuclease/putative transposase [Candidatus Eremiobacteraeota bacterium]|nr:Rpn family recombination-promoting nuclease/putative transposase [Candidatus Eremiobacteraeota bacterium]